MHSCWLTRVRSIAAGTAVLDSNWRGTVALGGGLGEVSHYSCKSLLIIPTAAVGQHGVALRPTWCGLQLQPLWRICSAAVS